MTGWKRVVVGLVMTYLTFLFFGALAILLIERLLDLVARVGL